MKPIRPARIISGAVYAERDPIYVGFTALSRGVDLSSGRPHAVMIREPGDCSGSQAERFALFAGAMVDRSKLAGTPVPRLLHAFGRTGHVLAVVEEYLRGVQLADVLDALLSNRQQLPVEIALAVARPLLRLWVAAASASPPVHFHLDPLRIIIDTGGNVRVLPEYARELLVPSDPSGVEGACSYLAPEQSAGQASQVGSGMYTFGILLYELLTSSHPLAGVDGDGSAASSQLTSGELPRITKRRSDLAASLVAFIQRCTARAPTGRFGNWNELAQHFVAAQASHPPAGPADIVGYLQKIVPAQLNQEPPPLADASVWGRMSDSGYEEVALPVRARSGDPGPPDRASS